MKTIQVLSVFAVLLFAPPVASQVADDKLIVPGARIGKWTLDMTIDDLLRMNGRRNATPGTRGGATVHVTTPEVVSSSDLWVHRWDNVGIRAVTIGQESQAIVALIAMTNAFRTDKGIGPGVTKEAVQQAYGAPAGLLAHPLMSDVRVGPGWWIGVYDELGLWVDVAATGEAASVGVFKNGSAKRIFKY